MYALRQRAMARLSEIDAVIIGGGAPHILSLSLPGYMSEPILNLLDAQGIFVSKGSACKKGRRSHVLESMKLAPKVIDGALRVSFSHYTTAEEVDALCDALALAKGTLRHF